MVLGIQRGRNLPARPQTNTGEFYNFTHPQNLALEVVADLWSFYSGKVSHTARLKIEYFGKVAQHFDGKSNAILNARVTRNLIARTALAFR